MDNVELRKKILALIDECDDIENKSMKAGLWLLCSADSSGDLEKVVNKLAFVTHEIQENSLIDKMMNPVKPKRKYSRNGTAKAAADLEPGGKTT